MNDYIIRTIGCLSVSLCFYMVMRNHRKGNFVMSALWSAPLIASVRAAFA